MPPAPSSLPVVFCFAGQGAQYYHMGADLLEHEPVFRQWMRIGDQLVRERHGISLLQATYDPDRRLSDPFDRLAVTHPALFLVQYAAAKLMQHHGVRPDMLLGVSLGEFCGMAVSGMVSFETMLGAIADKPPLFARTCPPGGLIAVLAPPEVQADSAVLAARTELVGVSADRHITLAALAEDLPAVEDELRRRDLIFQRLPVPHPFHSRWIDGAEAALRADLDPPRETGFWPVWSCRAVAPIDTRTPDLAWRIVRDPMKVRATVKALEDAGGARYVDISPSGTFAALIRQTLARESPSRVWPVLSPTGGNLKRLRHVLDALAPTA
ncbi:acyltransferase domain-containing protein [Roseospira navarrensis]|uniref:Acyltransferase domain-containing protein n=1 Tax=Roseospira navarrensis TaxID=140058 RepID=A0A7X1ZBU0_9PROT|nr:acyltransferase domain-containing protein [Roseospira navarrensis]MQX35696.1 acyltransferase domain-containing protein [Roseospira navarrensis]